MVLHPDSRAAAGARAAPDRTILPAVRMKIRREIFFIAGLLSGNDTALGQKGRHLLSGMRMASIRSTQVKSTAGLRAS
jgi:hypothetical protein